MSNTDSTKPIGGVAPFGYRWQNGVLVVDPEEAPVRKLIYELFLKHRRKKTVARLLNDLGYRTRSSAFFSDTTIDRLLRDTTAKGFRIVSGQSITVEPIVSKELWERANKILDETKPAKQAVALFTGIVYCGCGGKMLVSSNSSKYICIDCRRKIPTDDLEEIFCSQLKGFPVSGDLDLFSFWQYLSQKEKRLIVEHICDRIVVERDTIHIALSYFPDSYKTATDGQHNETGNETSSGGDAENKHSEISESLYSETDAAKFLGISKITLLRKRNAGEIDFFRIGSRILYSKEHHLIPFLKRRENAAITKNQVDSR